MLELETTIIHFTLLYLRIFRLRRSYPPLQEVFIILFTSAPTLCVDSRFSFLDPWAPFLSPILLKSLYGIRLFRGSGHEGFLYAHDCLGILKITTLNDLLFCLMFKYDLNSIIIKKLEPQVHDFLQILLPTSFCSDTLFLKTYRHNLKLYYKRFLTTPITSLSCRLLDVPPVHRLHNPLTSF
jgi:hypothetical protein